MLCEGQAIKDSTVKLFCPYCLIQKNRSKTFRSYHAIRHHLTTNHQDSLPINDIKLPDLIQNVKKAIEIGLVRL